METLKIVDEWMSWMMYVLIKWDLVILQGFIVLIFSLYIGEEILVKKGGRVLTYCRQYFASIFKG
jgi:hypothetical protein